MATMLEMYTTEEQRSVVRFCGQKSSIQNILIKKYFLFTVGKFLCKVVNIWMAKISLMRKGLKRKWLRQQSKDFYVVGFNALVKLRDKVISVCEDMLRNKCFFSVSNITFLRFISICGLITDTAPYVCVPHFSQYKE
jgi:hypothetical protein